MLGIKPSDNFKKAFYALRDALSGVEGVATVFGREKSDYSTMQKKENLDFKRDPVEVLDKIAFTIVIDDCENPMSIINRIFNKIKSSDKFSSLGNHGNEKKKKEYLSKKKEYTTKDWDYRVHNYVGNADGTCSYAKDNGYSSFHCGFRFNGIPIEIHIETVKMFNNNNFGEKANHDKVHKVKSQIDDAELDDLITMLKFFKDFNDSSNDKGRNTNFHENTLARNRKGRYIVLNDDIIPKLSALLKTYNIDLNSCLRTEDNTISNSTFIEIQKIVNRHFLHDLIILHANNITDEESSINQAYTRLLNQIKAIENEIQYKFPLQESIKNYCKYLGIKIAKKTTEELLKECIIRTNPVLYQLNKNNKLQSTTKHDILLDCGSYSSDLFSALPPLGLQVAN